MKKASFRLGFSILLLLASVPAARGQGYCGDGYCDTNIGEQSWCTQDCWFYGYCGDGLCQPEIGEDYNFCSVDCPPPPPADFLCMTSGSAPVLPADVEMQEMRAEALIPTPRVIYLNGAGGRYTTGDDNSSLNIASQIPGSAPKDSQGRTRFLAFHRPANWTQLVQCIKDKFARWDVRIVDDIDSAKPNDPGAETHIEAVITGTTSDSVGWPAGIGGVARPLSCGGDGSPVANDRGVAFIFARSYDTAFGFLLDELCTAAAHEIGHNLTLDHSLICDGRGSEIMFASTCTLNSIFLNAADRCKNFQGPVRNCACTANGQQNSSQRLDAVVGVKGAQPSTTITSPADQALVSRSQPFNVRATITSTAATVTRARLRWSTVNRPDEEMTPLGNNVWGVDNVSLADVPNGQHRIRIIAEDNLGRKKKSKKRAFTVTN